MSMDPETAAERRPAVIGDELDFEEMDLAEIPNADSGIVIAEAIDDDEADEADAESEERNGESFDGFMGEDEDER